MDKKKMIGIIVLVVVLLIGVISCNGLNKEETVVEPTTATTEPAPTQEPTEEPTAAPTEPSWVPGIVNANYGAAVAKTYNLGDTVTVKGEFDGFFIVAGEETDMLIETRYLRHAGEEKFEERVGYSYSGTEVFETAHLKWRGEPIANLSLNTKVDVIEGKEHWLHIKWDGGEGFVDADGISPNRISHNNGGGSSGPQDGTDIDLGGLSANGITGGVKLLANYYGPQFTEMEAVEGTILTDKCEAYVYLYSYGDEAKVTVLGEDVCEVYIDGIFATVPRWMLRMDGDEEYASWTGYARSNAHVYSKHQLRQIYEVRTMNLNEEVTVIAKLPHCYVVEIDGEIGYMHLDDIMTERYVYSGGGGSGGSGGDGGEWTPPAL